MELKITKGKIPSAVKCVLYGTEGIGKSTFASKLPSPLFIDTEGSTRHMDVSRLPTPKTWQELLEEVNYVIQNPSVCKTLVIDTIDWAEKLAITYTCARLNVKNIEDVGYGKGYVYLEQDFKHLLNLLDEVIHNNVHVFIIAHAQIRTFSEPDNIGQYDRYELKLQKKTSPLLKEWTDLLLFANYKTNIITDQKTGKTKGRGGSRVIYTTHTPSWDAKNRFNLMDELNFDSIQLTDLFDGGRQLIDDFNELLPSTSKPVDTLDIYQQVTDIVEDEIPQDIEKAPIAILIENCHKAQIDSDEIVTWAKANGQNFNDLVDFPQDFITYLNDNFDKLSQKIVDMRKTGGNK